MESMVGIARILIVDDDTGVGETFATMLRLEGFEVAKAIDAERALLSIQHQVPTAIILDMRMPIWDGLQFLRVLRRLRGCPPIPVTFVTGDYFLSDTAMSEIRDLHADFCVKPLWLEDLILLGKKMVAQAYGLGFPNDWQLTTDAIDTITVVIGHLAKVRRLSDIRWRFHRIAEELQISNRP